MTKMKFIGKNYVRPKSLWKLQNREQNTNPIYQYINLKQKGLLVTVMKKNPEEFDAFIRKELPLNMYNEGNGGTVTKREFMMWSDWIAFKLHQKNLKKNFSSWKDKFNFCEKAMGSPNFLSNCQGLEKFKEHEACWELRKRGSVGESIIHLAMLGIKLPIFRNIVRSLLHHFPKLALDVYEGNEYKGESGLHMAIVSEDIELMELFVEKGADINSRATGLFFLPEDQKEIIDPSITNYEGLAYYGEYPLAFSACLGNQRIYDYLIKHGANPDMQDTFGNTVLHMIVITNQLSMLPLVVNHHLKKANMDIVNYQNLTPLTLASKLGKNEAFEQIYKLLCVDIWCYSRTICSVYPVQSLDSIRYDGKCDPYSVLMTMVDCTSKNNSEILENHIINQILIEKWEKYGKKRFFEGFMFCVFQLALVCVIVYTRPDVIVVKEQFFPCQMSLEISEIQNRVKVAAESILIFMCVVYIVQQTLDIKAHGFTGYIKRQSGAPSKYLFNISCLVIPFIIPLRFMGLETIEKLLMAFTIPCAWANMLFFLRTFHFSGVYLVVFYKMLSGDLFRIGIIYIIFILGFTHSFMFLFKIKPNPDLNVTDIERDYTMIDQSNFELNFRNKLSEFLKDPEMKIESRNISIDSEYYSKLPFQTYGETFITLFVMSFGDYRNYANIEKTASPILSKLIYILFCVSIPIILINMITATFVNACDLVIKCSKREWKNQWTKIILVLERTFSPKMLRQFQKEYSIMTRTDKRGLVVMRKTMKSKAGRRKELKQLWKKLYNKVYNRKNFTDDTEINF